MNILSLFANVGVAEARFNELPNAHVVVANELIQRRAALYQQIYPKSKMICGDILDDNVFNSILKESTNRGVDVIMATPPCQGISTAGQKIENDERNSLTIPALHAISDLRPRYAILENVPGYLKTSIVYNGEIKLITDIISDKFSAHYHISFNVINTDDYGVPQTRQRVIIIGVRNDINFEYIYPLIDIFTILFGTKIPAQLVYYKPQIKFINFTIGAFALTVERRRIFF